MSELFWTALGLMLVIEGVLPLAAPRIWREGFRRLTELSDAQLRRFGLVSMALGLMLILLLR